MRFETKFMRAKLRNKELGKVRLSVRFEVDQTQSKCHDDDDDYYYYYYYKWTRITC
jgi:hypothetical protein